MPIGLLKSIMEDSYLVRDDSYRRHDYTSGGDDRSSCCCCGSFMFSISTVCYCITMGVGWALSQDVISGNRLALAAAIVSTIPVFAVAGYIYFMKKCSGVANELGVGEQVEKTSLICLCLIELCAAVFEVAGGIMFLVIGIEAEDNRIKAFGISAATFGFLSASSCCCGLICCCCLSNDC